MIAVSSVRDSSLVSCHPDLWQFHRLLLHEHGHPTSVHSLQKKLKTPATCDNHVYFDLVASPRISGLTSMTFLPAVPPEENARSLLSGDRSGAGASVEKSEASPGVFVHPGSSWALARLGRSEKRTIMDSHMFKN